TRRSSRSPRRFRRCSRRSRPTTSSSSRAMSSPPTSSRPGSPGSGRTRSLRCRCARTPTSSRCTSTSDRALLRRSPVPMTLPPEERHSLDRAHVPWSRGLWALVVTAVVVLLVLAVLAAVRPGYVEHALGQSTERTATVTGVEEAPVCSRSDRDVYTVEWGEDGARRSGQVGFCGDPWEVGEQVEIWSTSGAPQTSSPTALRVSIGALLAI